MTLLSTAKEANVGGSAIICLTRNPAIAPGVKIPLINSEKNYFGCQQFVHKYYGLVGFIRVRVWLGFRVRLGLGLVSGTSLVGMCRHLAAVVCSTYVSIVELWSIHDGHVRSMQARRSCP